MVDQKTLSFMARLITTIENLACETSQTNGAGMVITARQIRNLAELIDDAYSGKINFDAETKINELTDKASDLQDEIDTLTTNNDDLEDQKSELTKELENLKENLEEKDSEISDQAVQITQLREDAGLTN